MAKIWCAELNAKGEFFKMVHIEPSEVTALHLTTITECDLPPNKYQWIPDAGNPFGGAFWAHKWVKTAENKSKSSRPKPLKVKLKKR